MSENQAPAPQDFNGEIIQQFRANKGTMVSGRFKGRPLLLLSTRGARSGQTRVNPLVYTRDGDRYIIIASKGGEPTHPDWYHNVVANPEVTLEVGPARLAARAVVVEGAERERLYAAQAALMPNFVEYEKKTTRRIPVVALEPIQQ